MSTLQTPRTLKEKKAPCFCKKGRGQVGRGEAWRRSWGNYSGGEHGSRLQSNRFCLKKLLRSNAVSEGTKGLRIWWFPIAVKVKTSESEG